MEKKKISLSLFLAIVAILIIGAIGACFVIKDKESRKKSDEDALRVTNQAKEVENAVIDEEKTETKTENKTENKIEDEDEEKESTEKTEQILIDGSFSFGPSDVIYIFSNNGTVTRNSNTDSVEGTYVTIKDMQIELRYTKKTNYNIDTGRATINKINEVETFTYVDNNTLKNSNGENMTRFEISNESNEPTINLSDLDGVYSIGNSDVAYEFFGDGNVKCSGNTNELTGTYNINGDKVSVHFYQNDVWDIDTGEKTTKGIDETKVLTIIDKNTLKDENGYVMTKYSERNN